DLRAVTVGEQRVAHADRLGEGRLIPADLGGGGGACRLLDAVGERRAQRLLVLEVVVERARLLLERGPQPPPGQPRQAPLDEDAEGRIDARSAIVTYMPFGPHATHYTERRSPERCSPRHGDTMTDAPRRPQTRRFETR